MKDVEEATGRGKMIQTRILRSNGQGGGEGATKGKEKVRSES